MSFQAERAVFLLSIPGSALWIIERSNRFYAALSEEIMGKQGDVVGISQSKTWSGEKFTPEETDEYRDAVVSGIVDRFHLIRDPFIRGMTPWFVALRYRFERQRASLGMRDLERIPEPGERVEAEDAAIADFELTRFEDALSLSPD